MNSERLALSLMITDLQNSSATLYSADAFCRRDIAHKRGDEIIIAYFLPLLLTISYHVVPASDCFLWERRLFLFLRFQLLCGLS